MKRPAIVLPVACFAVFLLWPSSSAPLGMVKIPGGTFDYGTDPADIPALMTRYELPVRDIVGSEAPQRKVTVKAFYLDRTEVTVRAFDAFVARDSLWRPHADSGTISNGDYLKSWLSGRVPLLTDSLPVTYVTWFAARAFCMHAGKRLPTEVEWEYAAHGGTPGDVYPWGDSAPNTSRANYGAGGIGHPVVIMHYPPNGYGLYDMAGNVWEFLADQWTDPRPVPDGKPVEDGPWAKDRAQAATQRVVIRGGSYDGGPVNMRVRYRDSHPAGGAQPFVGFRCAKNP